MHFVEEYIRKHPLPGTLVKSQLFKRNAYQLVNRHSVRSMHEIAGFFCTYPTSARAVFGNSYNAAEQYLKKQFPEQFNVANVAYGVISLTHG